MGLNRNINDDSTLAYLFNKTRQGALDALQKAVDKINAVITTITTNMPEWINLTLTHIAGETPEEQLARVLPNLPLAKPFVGKVQIGSIFFLAGQLYEFSGDLYGSVLFNGIGPKQGGLYAISQGVIYRQNIYPAGDTMTGSLTINNSDLDVKNTEADVSRITDTANRVWHTRHQDKNGNNAAMWLTTFYAAGTVTTNIGARRIVNGTNQDNSVILGVTNDGTRTVALSAPTVWRDTLGLGTSVVEMKQIIQVNIGGFSSLPKTITNSAITADHIVVGYNCGTPSARVGQWSVTTANGSLTIAGTIRKTTTMRILLAVPRTEFGV